jgi:hypothetical protein
MNEEDLRDALAIMATAGLTFKHGAFDPVEPWRIADRIIEARNQEPEEGIVAIKKRTRRKA